MKILLATIEYPPFFGGVANYYGNMVKFWPDKNDIIVLDNTHNKLINSKFIPKWLPAFSNIFKVTKQNNVRHVLVGQILPIGTVVWILSFFSNFQYSVFLHGMDFSFAIKKNRKKFITKRILNKSKWIICSNSFTAREVKNFLGEDKKIKIVNPGIDPKSYIKDEEKEEELRKKYNLENKFIIFSIGRLVLRKGFDVVIKALKKMNSENCEYFIAGDGPDKNLLEKLAENLSNIHFLGKINDEEKWGWLNICDIFVTPSRNIDGDYEGFGIVFLEANLAGKAVIGGKTGGMSDAVADGKTGLLIDAENEDSFIQSLNALRNNKELITELGKNGKTRAVNEFNWNKKANFIYELIKS